MKTTKKKHVYFIMHESDAHPSIIFSTLPKMMKYIELYCPEILEQGVMSDGEPAQLDTIRKEIVKDGHSHIVMTSSAEERPDAFYSVFKRPMI